VASCENHRRYCFLKYAHYLRIDDDQYVQWDSKRRTISGIDIPSTFPARTALLAGGYLVLEELEGTDSTELTKAGLSVSQAAAVLAALE
jgi:hypothetical protein